MAVSVAELCQQNQLSARDLAEKSALEPSRVEAILEGRWTPSPTERSRIAGALGVGVEDIAWGHKIPIQHLYGHGPG